MAVGVVALLQGRTNKDNFISRVLTFVPETTRLWGKLDAAKSLAIQRPNGFQAVPFLIEMGTSAKVFETVAAAMVAFITTDSFKEAIETAIRAGGDTDTCAAMTGALAGTFYGFEQVAPYADHIEAGPELRALEQSLFNAAPPMYE